MSWGGLGRTQSFRLNLTSPGLLIFSCVLASDESSYVAGNDSIVERGVLRLYDGVGPAGSNVVL